MPKRRQFACPLLVAPGCASSCAQKARDSTTCKQAREILLAAVYNKMSYVKCLALYCHDLTPRPPVKPLCAEF